MKTQLLNRLYSFVFGAYLLGSGGCVTYSEDIKIYDNQGNIYRRPSKETSYEMMRNESEKLAEIPKGRKGFAIFEYVDGGGIQRKGMFRLDPAKSYVFYMTTSGEVWFYERDDNDRR